MEPHHPSGFIAQLCPITRLFCLPHVINYACPFVHRLLHIWAMQTQYFPPLPSSFYKARVGGFLTVQIYCTYDASHLFRAGWRCSPQ